MENKAFCKFKDDYITKEWKKRKTNSREQRSG